MLKAIILTTWLLTASIPCKNMDIQAGAASWYGYNDGSGKYTASGEILNPEGLTAASWHYPPGSLIWVFCPGTFKAVIVKVNDTGNFDKYGRLIDLSAGSFRKLAPLSSGEIKVVMIKVNPG